MKFISGYALPTAPLHKLLKKDVSFFWDDECWKNFERLQEWMIYAPLLNYPNGVKECLVHIDASGIALGTVLTWHGVGEIDHPIALAS